MLHIFLFNSPIFNKHILLSILLLTLLISCNKHTCEAEKILNEWMIKDIEHTLIRNKIKPDNEKMEDSTLQYFETFINEIKEDEDFDQSIENIIKRTDDSTFSDLFSKEISKVQSKKEIFNTLKSFYAEQYTCVFTLSEVALVNTDTIYLPRNRSFFKNKILYDRFSNSSTLANSSFYRNLSLNIDSISTFSQKDFITHTSEIKVRMPIGADYRTYQTEYTIAIFDPEN